MRNGTPFLHKRGKRGSSSCTAETYLRNAIIAGQFRPRQRIIEQDVADRLNVSRGPVREALRRLECDGLVVTTPRHGTFVRDTTPSEIGIVLKMRAKLEGLCVRYMRDNRSVDPQALLMNALTKLQSARNDEERFLRADLELHRIIWKAAGQPILERTLAVLMNPYISVIARSCSSRISLAERQASHEHYVRLVLDTPIAQVEREVDKYFETLYRAVFPDSSWVHFCGDADWQ